MKLRFNLYGKNFITIDNGGEEGEHLVFVPEKGGGKDKDVEILNKAFDVYTQEWVLDLQQYKGYDPTSNWGRAMSYVKGLGAEILEFEDVEYDENTIY